MAKIAVLDRSKKKVGEIDLSDLVFNAEVKRDLVHQVVTAQLAARRSGNASTKTRGDMKGGGKKPYKQKGTGNARRGSQVSPLIVGGGQTHGPKPRSYEQKVNKKMARGAIVSLLSDKFKSERLIILKDLNFSKIKTKEAQILVDSFGWNKALFVDEPNENFMLSVRNIPGCSALRTEGVNAYDLVKHEWLVLSEKAASSLSDHYGKAE